MSDDPENEPQQVSMFQVNSIAILSERQISWARLQDNAVSYLENAQWGAVPILVT
jgi:hypothetical protein